MGRLRVGAIASLSALLVVVGSVAATADTGRAKKAPDPLDQVAGPWVKVTGNEAAFSGGRVTGATVAGKTLVAYGTVGTTRALWTSADGLRWTRVPDTALGLTPEQLAAPTTGGRYAEFLVAGDDDGVTAMVNRAVIASPDGVTWEPLADPAAGTSLRDPALVATFSDPASFVDHTLMALAVSGDTRTAVGTGCWCAPFRSGDRTPFAIGSADGTSWSGGPLWGEGGGRGEMLTVVATKAGFVAAGYAGPIDDRSDAAVWRSPDGITWTRAEQPTLAAPDYEQITQLAANRDRLLGIGDHGTLPGSRSGFDLYRSVDGGATWTRTAADPAVFIESGPSKVFAIGDGFAVIGRSIPSGATASVPTVFTTTDGQTFTAAWTAARTGAIGITAIAPRPDGLVALLPEAVVSGPPSTLVYVSGPLAKKAVKAKLATPPTTTTTTKPAKSTSTAGS